MLICSLERCLVGESLCIRGIILNITKLRRNEYADMYAA